MSIRPLHTCVITAFCLAFFTAAPARALVLDWDTAVWAPGDLVNSYDLNGDTVNDITVKVTSQQANIWAVDPTSGSQAPVDNQTLTGGLSPAQNSLMLAANLHTKSACTVQISFTGGNGALNTPGATNVSFTIFDIDITTNADVISSIYGVAPDGTHVAATITNVGSAVTLAGIGLAQELTGNAASPDNSGNGNVTISFGSTLITDVFFNFGNTAGAPRYQDIAIGDISFTPVPEINPAAASGVSCLLAVGLATFVHRRGKPRVKRLPSAEA
ncbi:MAG TPA: hypothetical protein VF751_10005 [Chthoniobacterales bacterium]